jgi:hypothetical protein
MPFEQRGEGITIAVLDEKAKKLPVAQSGAVSEKCSVP